MEDRRRGGRGKKLEDPEIFFKLSSLSLLVWKVGKIPHFHSFIVSLSLFCHLMRRRLPRKLVEKYI